MHDLGRCGFAESAKDGVEIKMENLANKCFGTLKPITTCVGCKQYEDCLETSMGVSMKLEIRD